MSVWSVTPRSSQDQNGTSLTHDSCYKVSEEVKKSLIHESECTKISSSNRFSSVCSKLSPKDLMTALLRWGHPQTASSSVWRGWRAAALLDKKHFLECFSWNLWLKISKEFFWVVALKVSEFNLRYWTLPSALYLFIFARMALITLDHFNPLFC